MQKFQNFKVLQFSKIVEMGSTFVCMLVHPFKRSVKISSHLKHFWKSRHFRFWTINFQNKQNLKRSLKTKYRFGSITYVFRYH